MRSIKGVLKRYMMARRMVMLRRQVERVLASPHETIVGRAEQDFAALQSRYQPRSDYGYDPLSIFKRASERATSVLHLPGLDTPGLKGLDLGAGDGMLGVLLEAFGHHMTLTDSEDWRVSAAGRLSMVAADCCKHLPLSDNTFDFVVSFNAFEHFPDPLRAMEEVLRVTRSGGLMHFHFGPLYYGPWGLHAYRTLRMPYAQYLFSESFIRHKLEELGIWDLGKKRHELQTLNKWTPDQFEALWMRPEIDVIVCHWHVNEGYLDLVLQYPECFRGRGLTLEDLVRDGVLVTMRRK